MKILCVYGSRADYGGMEAVHQALIRHNIDSTFGQINHFGEGFDSADGELTDVDEFDLVVLLGDRYEVLYFALYTYMKKKPIAHLSGGDITEGSQDDSMRHAITKLSHIHFPTSNHAAKVILQLGEEPWRVHMVGYPGADSMVTHDKDTASKLVGAEDYILAVWHPNTLVSEGEALAEATVLAIALQAARGNSKVFVVGPNYDSGGLAISNYLSSWADRTGNRYMAKLPRDMYLTLVKYAKCMVGNSSSGFYEAPSFGTPVVNVGDRQKGRIVPPNMTCATISMDDIIESINIALTTAEHIGTYRDNVYQTGNAADRIAQVISEMKDPAALLLKRFCHQ